MIWLALAAAALSPTQRTSVPGFVGGEPEPAFDLATRGTAGGLIGPLRAVSDLDRALMTGQLKGCASPKRIVQRDGELYGVPARNIIFPDDDLIAIVSTNRASDDFAIGEVWQGKGFAYDLLSAAACA